MATIPSHRDNHANECHSRVDLRPTTSTEDPDAAAADPTTDTLAPPLQSDDPATRRHSTLRDILSFRARPNASADERISALRRLREQRRNGSGEVVSGSANVSSEDVAQDRRRNKRMSFFGRRRGEGVDASSSNAQPARTEESPARERGGESGDDTTARASAGNDHANANANANGNAGARN